MRIHAFIVAIAMLLSIAIAGEKGVTLRQQLREALATGRKIEFGDAEHRFGLSFLNPPEHDREANAARPLTYFVGDALRLREDWRTFTTHSVKECRKTVSRYTSLCREVDEIPRIWIRVDLEHDEGLLRALLDQVAMEQVKVVWIYLQTKADLYRQVERLPPPRPIPPSKQTQPNKIR